jgi:hypothetical protein
LHAEAMISRSARRLGGQTRPPLPRSVEAESSCHAPRPEARQDSPDTKPTDVAFPQHQAQPSVVRAQVKPAREAAAPAVGPAVRRPTAGALVARAHLAEHQPAALAATDGAASPPGTVGDSASSLQARPPTSVTRAASVRRNRARMVDSPAVSMAPMVGSWSQAAVGRP